MGMITVDDIVHIISQEAGEDILRLSGAGEGDINEPVLDSYRARVRWLLTNLLTALVASTIIGIFEGTIQQMVALATLMPIVAGVGGNAGSQGLVVAVRAIAERQLEGDAVRRAILREVLSGLVNGVLFAVGVGLVAQLWFHDVKLSLVLASAMMATFLWAAFSGILVPLGLKKLGADPAVASSVFVLTLTDVMAFFSFLGLATLVLL